MKTNTIPILAFKTITEWQNWLHEHFTLESGIWLRIYKKNSKNPTVTYLEAPEETLCYGWIDGQVKKYDEESYIQKFTPRRKKSMWSKINRERVEHLTKEGRMQPSGAAEIEAAKADGRWQQAYDSPSTATIPEDFLLEVKKDAVAYKYFQTLKKTDLYHISWQLQTAKKAETRTRRMKVLIEMLKNKHSFH